MARTATPPPLVSVVMPNHNGAAWLGQAVESILAQTLADFELLVVDDGSTDASRTLLEGFAARDRRVTVIAQSRAGLTTALNRGLAAARAPLLARLDSDDLSRPTRLMRQTEFMAAHPEVGLLGSWAMQIDGDGRPRGERRPLTAPDDLAQALERSNPFIHSSIMARTDLLRRLRGYRDVFEAAEDYDLWLRLAEVSGVANLPEFLISYRMHDANVSRTKSLRQAFSVRLAQGAARGRRDGAGDPADGLAEPPDWNAAIPADAFYAPDAALFRWLDQGGELPECDLLIEALPDLTHAERRLAALSLAARIRSRDQAQARAARALLLRLLSRRPHAVLKAVWSLRT